MPKTFPIGGRNELNFGSFSLPGMKSCFTFVHFFIIHLWLLWDLQVQVFKPLQLPTWLSGQAQHINVSSLHVTYFLTHDPVNHLSPAGKSPFVKASPGGDYVHDLIT